NASLNDRSNGLVSAPLEARGISPLPATSATISRSDQDGSSSRLYGEFGSSGSVDDFLTPGVFVEVGDNTHLPSVCLAKVLLRLEDIESMLSHASLRVRTSITNGN